MNTDIRIDVGFLDHWKTETLIAECGVDSVLSLIRIWIFAAQNKPNGQLDGIKTTMIERVAKWRGEGGKLITCLSDLRFLEQDENGVWCLHDWEEHNPYAAHAPGRRERAKRAAAAKYQSQVERDGYEYTNVRSKRLADARLKGTHTAEEWTDLVDMLGGVCLKCGGDSGIVKDHILPLYQGGSDGLSNLQPLCRSCNSSKGPESKDHRPGIIPSIEWSDDKCISSALAVHKESYVGAERSLCTPPSPSPSPAPTPTPVVKDKNKETFPRPDFISPDLWKEVLDSRKFKKLQNTPLALTTFCNAIKAAIDQGYTADQCIGEYVSSGWKRFNVEWMKSQGKLNSQKPRSKRDEDDETRARWARELLESKYPDLGNEDVGNQIQGPPIGAV